jgi:hypothetical protein
VRKKLSSIFESFDDSDLYIPARVQRDRKKPPRQGGSNSEQSLDPLDDQDNENVEKGGTWGVPGQGQTTSAFRSRVGVPALYNAEGGKVQKWETEKVAQRTKQVLPDRLLAFSRGAATYNQTIRDEPDMPRNVPVTYLAPSSYRKWSNAPVPKAPRGSVTIIGDDDKIVPLKQACKNAVDASTKLYVQPGYSHNGIMYTGGEIDQDAFEIDAKSCALDPELPDWERDARGSEEDHEKQQAEIKKHIKNENMIRAYVKEFLMIL